MHELRRIAEFLLVLGPATLVAAGTATAESIQLKLMTYNVKAPGWNPNRRAQVVGAIGARYGCSRRPDAPANATLGSAAERHSR